MLLRGIDLGDQIVLIFSDKSTAIKIFAEVTEQDVEREVCAPCSQPWYKHECLFRNAEETNKMISWNLMNTAGIRDTAKHVCRRLYFYPLVEKPPTPPSRKDLAGRFQSHSSSHHTSLGFPALKGQQVETTGSGNLKPKCAWQDAWAGSSNQTTSAAIFIPPTVQPNPQQEDLYVPLPSNCATAKKNGGKKIEQDLIGAQT